MSLIFDKADISSQTHVFLIGVGDYPFLKDGEKAIEQEGDLASLGQLSSPQVSIEKIYHTILSLDKDNSWVQPLGSVEVVLSPIKGGVPVFKDHKIERASRKNIYDAYFRWKKRCDQNKDNVAFFYFCGHGLGKAEHFLLADDFGENPQNPWEGAFAFDKTRSAFNSCAAETTMFFVDACRELTDVMLYSDLTGIAPLENPKYRPESRYYLTMRASASNESAFGRKDGLSIFSEAIINGLREHAAFNQDDEWKITTTSICTNIYKLLGQVDPSQDYPQRCNYNNNQPAHIITLKNPPVVDLVVQCSPVDAHDRASLSARHTGNAKNYSRKPDRSPWSIKVDAGIYEIDADFENNTYPHIKKFLAADPPSANANIKCV